MDKYYDVYVFTASVREYADPLIDHIDPNHLVKQRYFRESCILNGDSYIKDLRVNSLRLDLSQTIIVDNSPISYSHNEENAVPISNFLGGKNDKALFNLIPFLHALASVDDVRSILGLRPLN